MSRQPRINWRDSDLQETKRVIRNYNAKIKRLLKKNPQVAKNLPRYYNSKTETFDLYVKIDEFRELINTRQDLNRELNALKRFSKRGAETLVKLPDNDNNIEITKWQRTEMNRRTATINRKRKKRLEYLQSIEMKDNGELAGYTYGELGMGKPQINELQPFKAFTASQYFTDVQWKFRTLLAESQSDYYIKQDYLLRNNYIKSLLDNFNISDVQDTIDVISSMPISEFLRVFYEQGGNFEYSYPPDDDQYPAYKERLESIWDTDTRIKKVQKAKVKSRGKRKRETRKRG